jgi:flagellar basal-body rod protein FlgG
MENSLDFMIQGKGFFEIQRPDVTLAYTRNGQFSLDENGRLVTSGAGYPLQPEMNVPPDASSISISQQGEVTVQLPGQPEGAVIGQLTITDFINPAGLEPIGQNLFTETGVSGAPNQGNPGENGLGMIVQGALETSNVNVTEELVNMIESQRVYEMNSKVISSVDQMLSFITQQL